MEKIVDPTHTGYKKLDYALQGLIDAEATARRSFAALEPDVLAFVQVVGLLWIQPSLYLSP
jgi:hypothetical protein